MTPLNRNLGLAGLLLLTLAGCTDGKPDGYVVDMTQYSPQVSVHSGNNQSTSVSTAFANPLVVKLGDATGRVFPSHLVTFEAPASGASGTFNDGVNPPSTTTVITTNANGLAQAPPFTANANAGPFTVKITSSHSANTVYFTLTNN